MLSSAVIEYLRSVNYVGKKKIESIFLLECKTLEENRKTQMVKLGEALEEARGGGWYTDYRTKWAAYANHLGLHLM